MTLSQYCKQCVATCCKKWTIFTTIEDIHRITAFTGKNPKEFSEFSKIPDWEILQYAQKFKFHFYNLAKSGSILQLKKNNNCCIFLSRNECRIYEVRPYICRLYPFLRRRTRFEIIICIGYKNVCTIPETILNSYRKEQKVELLIMASEYYREMNDYKIKIDSFVKKIFRKDDTTG